MDSLVIHAISRESAEGFCAALADLQPKLITERGGRYRVEITLGGSDTKIGQALSRLEEYVSARGDGPARLNLGGRDYTLHPTEAA